MPASDVPVVDPAAGPERTPRRGRWRRPPAEHYAAARQGGFDNMFRRGKPAFVIAVVATALVAACSSSSKSKSSSAAAAGSTTGNTVAAPGSAATCTGPGISNGTIKIGVLETESGDPQVAADFKWAGPIVQARFQHRQRRRRQRVQARSGRRRRRRLRNGQPGRRPPAGRAGQRVRPHRGDGLPRWRQRLPARQEHPRDGLGDGHRPLRHVQQLLRRRRRAARPLHLLHDVVHGLHA